MTKEPIPELTKWNFPSKKTIPDGYYLTEAPTASDDNFALLVERHNDLVRAFNELNARFNLPDNP